MVSTSLVAQIRKREVSGPRSALNSSRVLVWSESWNDQVARCSVVYGNLHVNMETWPYIQGVKSKRRNVALTLANTPDMESGKTSGGF
jgi:hypothetical protein